jgi:hypothetical protein
MGLLGIALTIFGIGESTFVALFPMMRVQLSAWTLIPLAVMSAACIAFGLGIVAYLAIKQATGIRWTIRSLARQHSIWLLAVAFAALAAVFAWQTPQINSATKESHARSRYNLAPD